MAYGRWKCNFPLLLITACGLSSIPASAGVITQPGDSTTCCGVYDTGTTLFLLPAEGNTFSSLASGAQTLTFGNTLVSALVPSSWATWSSPPNSESSTPAVAYDPAISDTLTLSQPVAIFGFELEPADFGTHSYTVDYYNGSTLLGSITIGVEGNAGARLFAQEVSGNLINKVTVGGDSSDGFAMANLRFALSSSTSVPEPGSGVLILLGGALASFRLFGRKNKA
jgi:hypothetical protein